MAAVAHDLNNLLQTIVAHAELLKEAARGEQLTLRAASSIEVATKRAAELIQQLQSALEHTEHEE